MMPLDWDVVEGESEEVVLNKEAALQWLQQESLVETVWLLFIHLKWTAHNSTGLAAAQNI